MQNTISNKSFDLRILKRPSGVAINKQTQTSKYMSEFIIIIICSSVYLLYKGYLKKKVNQYL